MASSARTGITCAVEAQEGITLRPDSAVPVALIVTEAIANALEHGFPQQESGAITVRLARFGDGVLLRVEDDGRGLPPGFDPASAQSIGLRISRILSQQLEGQIVLENGARGTRMTLELPLSRLAETA
jgi:two-component sensor histidine kinase